MSVERVAEGVYRVGLGFVNAYLIDSDGDVTIVDSGTPGKADLLMAALAEIGRSGQEVGRIILTHLHFDHAGSAAALRERIETPVSMHGEDAALIREGRAARPFSPAPRLWARLAAAGMGAVPQQVDPVPVEEELSDGAVLPSVRDARVIHVPGHSAGQIALLLPQDGGLLIAADAATHFLRLDYPPIFEDLEQGRQSLRRLAGESFSIACFGHGRPVRERGAEHFARRFGGVAP